MDKIKLAIAGVAILLVGASIGRYLSPSKVQEKIVEKEVTKTNEHTVTVVVKDPNGKETTTITDDKNTTIVDDKKTDIIISSRPDWHVRAGTGWSFDQGKQTYIIGIDRRIISEVSVGIYGTTAREAGVTLSIGF